MKKAGEEVISRVVREHTIAGMEAHERKTNAQLLEEFCESHNVEVEPFMRLIDSLYDFRPTQVSLLHERGVDRPEVDLIAMYLQVGVRIGFQAAQLERVET